MPPRSPRSGSTTSPSAASRPRAMPPTAFRPVGQRVVLRNNANLSTGGTATDVTDDVHPEVAARAVDAAQMVGLHICGVDMVCENVLSPLEEQHGGMVEVNAAPGLRMHLAFVRPAPRGRRSDGREHVRRRRRRPHPGGRRYRHQRQDHHRASDQPPARRQRPAHRHDQHRRRLRRRPPDRQRRLQRPEERAQRAAASRRRRRRVRGRARRHPARRAWPSTAARWRWSPTSAAATISGSTTSPPSKTSPVLKRVVVRNVAPDGYAVLNAADPIVAAMAASCPGSVIFFAARPAPPGDGHPPRPGQVAWSTWTGTQSSRPSVARAHRAARRADHPQRHRSASRSRT